MGSSRASTPAGRKRASRRAAQRSGSHRAAAARKPARGAASKAAPKKGAAKRAAPKTLAPKTKTQTRRTKPRSRKAPSRPRTRAPRLRGRAGLAARAPRVAAIALVVLGLLAAGYFLWFRNSSFVAVEAVSVTGIEGPEAAAVKAALEEEAGEMTTLNVDEDALRDATAGFPTVVGVSADADFPRGLAIHVRERPPVLLATAGGRALPVAGDGTVLPGVDPGEMKLPTLAVGDLPAEGKLEGDALQIALVLGGAPEPLRELIEDVSFGGAEGVQVTLRGDLPVYFGGGEAAKEKWAAAAAILANPKITTLTYLDVRVADRPAVGGAAPAVDETTTTEASPELPVTTIATP
jgi:cell division septal protein FtsQ